MRGSHPEIVISNERDSHHEKNQPIRFPLKTKI